MADRSLISSTAEQLAVLILQHIYSMNAISCDTSYGCGCCTCSLYSFMMAADRTVTSHHNAVQAGKRSSYSQVLCACSATCSLQQLTATATCKRMAFTSTSSYCTSAAGPCMYPLLCHPPAAAALVAARHTAGVFNSMTTYMQPHQHLVISLACVSSLACRGRVSLHVFSC
jgi:hypothetical protein